MIDERIKIKGLYLIEAMQAVSQLYGDTDIGRFYKIKADKAKPIHLTSVKELFSEEELKELLKAVKPKMHGCFQTAQRLSMFHGFGYVEGEWGIGGGLGIEHAYLPNNKLLIVDEEGMYRVPLEINWMATRIVSEVALSVGRLPSFIFGNVLLVNSKQVK